MWRMQTGCCYRNAGTYFSSKSTMNVMLGVERDFFFFSAFLHGVSNSLLKYFLLFVQLLLVYFRQ